MAAAVEAYKNTFQKEVESLRLIQGDIQKLITTRTQLQSQVNENEMVLEELNRLSDDASVFKMIGPALVKQDLMEAKSNVNKRIEYIKAEIDRLDNQIKSLQSRVSEKENEEELFLQTQVLKMQRKLQSMVQAS